MSFTLATPVPHARVAIYASRDAPEPIAVLTADEHGIVDLDAALRPDGTHPELGLDACMTIEPPAGRAPAPGGEETPGADGYWKE